jgi:hypothetical protein
MSTVLLDRYRSWVVAASLASVTLLVIGASAQAPQAPPPPQTPLPLTPQRERGASISPAYEGWYPNADGSFSMLLGYYNRNGKEPLDIPVGPNNHVDPGGPDQGQPTHFEVGRQWGVFVVKVPKDFGTKAITWTIVANGESQAIPFTLNKGYPISPYKELGMGNQPPVLAFAQGGPKFTGPPLTAAASFTGTVNQPVPINLWVEDPKSPNEVEGGGRGFGLAAKVATISLHKFRGPGKVTFDKPRIPVNTQGEMITPIATFDAPGEYTLRVQANDESGEGGAGFQCCWTNAYLKVTVRP